MLEKAVEPITSLKSCKTYYGPFKINTGTTFTYEQYSKQLISDETTHEKNSNWALSLAINDGGLYMILKNFPMMVMMLHLK